MVDTLSSQITNRDAVPRVLEDSRESKARLMESCATLEAGAADASDSTYRFFSIPSNARVSQVLLSCDDLGTAGAVDVGLYDTTENGSAVVDADLFASAQVLTTALTNSDITHESAVFGIEDSEKPIWEALGLSADPNKDYDVVATVTAAPESAGTISMKGRFVV